MMYKKGDIMWVPFATRNKRKLKHPAVIWDDYFDGSTDFRGIMLTREPPSDIYDNILMQDAHFQTGHKFKFDNTHFVNQVFIKFRQWEFNFWGQLTNEGVQFIEHNLTNCKPVPYSDYIKMLKRP